MSTRDFSLNAFALDAQQGRTPQPLNILGEKTLVKLANTDGTGSSSRPCRHRVAQSPRILSTIPVEKLNRRANEMAPVGESRCFFGGAIVHRGAPMTHSCTVCTNNGAFGPR